MMTTQGDDPPGLHMVRLAAARVLGVGDGLVRATLSVGIVLVLIGTASQSSSLVASVGTTLTFCGLLGLLLVPPVAVLAAVLRAAAYDDPRTVTAGCAVLAMVVLGALTKFL